MGHEIAGEVAEVGESVAGIAVGDRVAVEPLVTCRVCAYCLSGERQLCPQKQLLGAGQYQGGFAEYLEVPAYLLHKLPDDLSFEVGALVEPLAVCVHAYRLAEIQPAERVAVLGAGTIGLTAVLTALELGASEVYITARYPHQADLARSLGAAQVFTADEDGTAQLQTSAFGRPFDIVVETVGGEANTFAQALSLARPGGRVAILGLFTRPVKVHPLPLALSEVKVFGSLTYGSPGHLSDFALAAGIAARRAEQLARLITHRVPLQEIQQGFETALDKSSGAVKVTVAP
jgi:threonine dehydrogenase-like Zn-dependent dehydrogenase